MKHALFLSAIEKRGKMFAAEVLRVGKWKYPGVKDGEFEITEAVLAEMKKQWEAGTRGSEVPLNVDHKPGSDCGWVKDFVLSEDGKSAFALFEITDAGIRQKVADGTLKYTSSEIDLSYVDPEACASGKCKPAKVFEGLALTNKPYVKRMREIVPIALCEVPKEQDEMPTVEELQMQLAERDQRIKDLEEGDASAQLAELQKENKQLLETHRQATQKANLREVTTKLRALVNAGRLTLPMFESAYKLCASLIVNDSATIKLSNKVKFSEKVLGTDDPAAITCADGEDGMDVVQKVLDVLEQIPGSIATDAEVKAAELAIDNGAHASEATRLRHAADQIILEEKAKGNAITLAEAYPLAEKRIGGVQRVALSNNGAGGN